eukprot:PhF_6_TR25332/c0_g1_i1/m.35014
MLLYLMCPQCARHLSTVFRNGKRTQRPHRSSSKSAANDPITTVTGHCLKESSLHLFLRCIRIVSLNSSVKRRILVRCGILLTSTAMMWSARNSQSPLITSSTAVTG